MEADSAAPRRREAEETFVPENDPPRRDVRLPRECVDLVLNFTAGVIGGVLQRHRAAPPRYRDELKSKEFAVESIWANIQPSLEFVEVSLKQFIDEKRPRESHLAFVPKMGSFGFGENDVKPRKWEISRYAEDSEGGWFTLQGSRNTGVQTITSLGLSFGTPWASTVQARELLLSWMSHRQLFGEVLNTGVTVPVVPWETSLSFGSWMLFPVRESSQPNWKTELLSRDPADDGFRYGFHGTSMNCVYRAALNGLTTGMSENMEGNTVVKGIFYHIRNQVSLIEGTYLPHSCIDRSGWAFGVLLQLKVQWPDKHGRKVILRRKANTHQSITYPDAHEVVGVWFHMYHILHMLHEPASIWNTVEGYMLAECELDPTESWESIQERSLQRRGAKI